MPVSKNGKTYYTRAQYQKAAEISALEYAQAKGYDLVPDGGGYYHLREHDSMIFTPDGKWFWNSRHVRGGAIHMLMHYEGKTLTEAVLTLAGDTSPGRSHPAASKKPVTPPEAAPKVFVPPERATNFRRLFAYLCQTRGLSRDVVNVMLEQQILYEGILMRHGKECHNVVFVYRDPDGQAVGAFLRGMSTKVQFKQDAPGSKKQYGWLLSGSENAKLVLVFEAAIDAASHYDLSGGMDVHRLSLEGLHEKPLWEFLSRHPEIRDVGLCLDDDEPGQKAAKNLKKALTAKRYHVTIIPPPYGKDWNDALLHRKQK